MSTLPITLRLLLLCLLPLAYALKFELSAESHPSERCVRNFVNRDTLVVVTATISGAKGDGQRVDMHVRAEPWCGPGRGSLLT